MSASNECPVSLLVLISLLLFVWPSVAMRFPSQSFRHHTYAYHHSHAQQTTSQSSQLQDVFSWKALDFAFPSEFTRNEAVNLGSFIPGAPVPIDADVYYGEGPPVVFITIPRWQKGVPVTLGYVTQQVSRDGNPLIAPYPNWEAHKPGNCNGLTSVFRIAVDECDRLWVLDTGKIEDVQTCPPQLLSFDLKTNKLISRYQFPNNQYKQNSLFITPVLDIRQGSCSDTFVYIADVAGFALLVYDHRNTKSWVIRNNLFFPYPPHGTYTINSESFDLMDGIFALALGPIQLNNDRTLYFHSLASITESFVQTSVIRNSTLFQRPNAAARQFQSFPMKRSTQAAAEAMNRDGVSLFGLVSDNSLGCWNSNSYDYGMCNIDRIAVDRQRLQFTSGLKIIRSKQNIEEVWLLTSALQKFMAGSISSNVTNFWILKGNVNELTRGTRCDVSLGYPAKSWNGQQCTNNMN